MTGMDVLGFQVGDDLSSYLQTCVASSIGLGSSSASMPERPHQLISECSCHGPRGDWMQSIKECSPELCREEASEGASNSPSSERIVSALPNSCKLQLRGRITGCRHEPERRH